MSKLTILLIAILMSGILGCKGPAKEALNEEGQVLFRQGNFNGAIVYYKNALEKDAAFLPARFNLALAYLETGKLDQAERELRKVLEQSPEDSRVNLHLGRIANLRNTPDLAISLLAAYLTAHPDDATALEQLALAATLKGDVLAAREHLKRALIAEPGRISSRIALARSYMSQGERGAAREILERLLTEDPKNRSALHVLGQLEAQERDPEGMLDVYARISSLYPTDLLARYKEGSLRLDKGDMDRAKAQAESLMAEYPDKPEGHRLMGRLLFQEGRHEDAVTHLQKSIRLRPDLEAYYLLGLAYFNLGNLEMAVTQFQTILDYNPDFAQARLLIGEIFLRQGRGAEAAAVADKMLQANPSDFLGFALRGDALLLQQKPREALVAVEDALKLVPGHHGLLLKKGMLKLSLGEGSGEADLVAAVKASPGSIDARMALHTLYVRAKRIDDATRILEEGLRGGKDDALLYNALAKVAFGRKDAEVVRGYLDKARTADPALPQTYYNAAALCLTRGEIDEALRQYDLLLALRPRDVRALIGSAGILDSQNRTDAARERLETARATGDTGAILILSRYLRGKGHGDEAVAVLEAALQGRPGDAVLIQAKARLHMARKEMDKAMALYDQLEAADPWGGTLERTKAWMSVGDLDKAEQGARRLVALSPDRGESHASLSAILEARADRDAAGQQLRTALSRDPGNDQIGVLLGDFHVRGREWDQALQAYEAVLRRSPANAPALTGKGTVLQLMGRLDEAMKSYALAVQASPDHVPALNNLAMLWAENETTKVDALNLAMAAFVRSNTEPSVIDTLGYTLLRNNRFEDALKVLDRAVALEAGNGAILYHCALALSGLDRRTEAVAVLRVALDSGNFEERSKAQALLRSLHGEQ